MKVYNIFHRLLSWTPGQTEWTYLAELHYKRTLHCVASDGTDYIWAIGGCDGQCWTDGWIEEYSINANTWTKINAMPKMPNDNWGPLNYTTTNDETVYSWYRFTNVCGYANGYVYVTFSTFQWWGSDGLIHVFDTKSRTWLTPDARLRKRRYVSSSIVLSYQ